MATENPLGKQIPFPKHYAPEMLVAIPRLESRKSLGIDKDLPFTGADIWNAYELSWLDLKGKPVAAILRMIIPCDSQNIVESKSLKLYLSSFSQEKIDSIESLALQIQRDLEELLQGPVALEFNLLNGFEGYPEQAKGHCLDNLDINVDTYQPDSNFLKVDNNALEVAEVLYTHLFRSNCPITQQPDWATMTVCYQGKPIDHEGLLKYLISYRQHDDYHEHCVERIYCDIQKCCQPMSLTVEANFLRRGGIDINPIRTSEAAMQYNAFPRYLRQ